MSRLIDADKLINDGWVLERHGVSNKLLSSMSIADVPTVEAEPTRHGHWIKKTWYARGSYKYHKCKKCGEEDTIQKPHNEEIIVCSECGKINESAFENYCPNCGARMDLID